MSDDKIQNPPSTIASALETEAVKVLSKVLGSAMEGVFSSFGDLYSGAIGIYVQEWKTKKLIHGLERTHEFLKQKNVKPEFYKHLPMGVALQIFDNISSNDDDDISILWAKLLANSLDPNTDVNPSNDIITLIKAFTPLDAMVMEFIQFHQNIILSANNINIPPANNTSREKIKNKIMLKYSHIAKHNNDDILCSINHLTSLGLIFAPIDPIQMSPPHLYHNLSTGSQSLVISEVRLSDSIQKITEKLVKMNRADGYPLINIKINPFHINYIPTPLGMRFLTAIETKDTEHSE